MKHVTKMWSAVKSTLAARNLLRESLEHYAKGEDLALFHFGKKKGVIDSVFGGVRFPKDSIHAKSMFRSERQKYLMLLPQEELVEDFMSLLANAKLTNSLYGKAIKRYRESLEYQDRAYLRSTSGWKTLDVALQLPLYAVRDAARGLGYLKTYIKTKKSEKR